nr:bifunctional hydroxymethylpyrimidine kinase/phosphomethylpyrimidine kinase [Chloroflexia bacterium]
GRLGVDLVETLRRELFPRAHVITLGLAEAELFAGSSIRCADDAREALRRIRGDSGNWVFLAGSADLTSARDVVFDGEQFFELDAAHEWTGERREALSAAVAARLALGQGRLAAIEGAKAFVDNAVAHSFAVGAGRPLPHHLFERWRVRSSAQGEKESGQ